jgi:ATP-binding cassette subfamily B (MDR/TAP) protein 1
MALLERYYDILDGSIQIDDVDLREMNIRHTRRGMSIVGQEPILFNLSIRENIAYGLEDKDVTEEMVVEASKLANIHNFVCTLPHVSCSM